MTAEGAGIAITWAPPNAPPPVADADAAVFEGLDGSGHAIVQTGTAAASADTVSYRHRTTEPADTDGIFGNAPFLLAVRLYVPEPFVDDVRTWLEDEHIAMQLAVSGTFWYGGYEASTGRFAFLNLWGLRDPEVIETPEWAAARDTAWRQRLLPAFKEMDRAVYRRLSR